MDRKDLQLLNELFSKSSAKFKLVRENASDIYQIISDLIITTSGNPSDKWAAEDLYLQAAEYIKQNMVPEISSYTDDDDQYGLNREIKAQLKQVVSDLQDDLGRKLGQDLNNYIDIDYIIELLSSHGPEGGPVEDMTGQDEDQEEDYWAWKRRRERADTSEYDGDEVNDDEPDDDPDEDAEDNYRGPNPATIKSTEAQIAKLDAEMASLNLMNEDDRIRRIDIMKKLIELEGTMRGFGTKKHDPRDYHDVDDYYGPYRPSHR